MSIVTFQRIAWYIQISIVVAKHIISIRGRRSCSQTCGMDNIGTAIKSIITNARNKLGNSNACQTTTAKESIFPNACNRLGNRDAWQTSTTGESIIRNPCNRVRNANTGQTGATRESII